MDTKKSDSLEDHFELPSFGLKIYNMNTGNQTVTVVMHLSIETPTPGLCGAMWGIFMVFEGMVSPWGWGISQDLLSIFMEVHGSRGARWGFDSCLVSSR